MNGLTRIPRVVYEETPETAGTQETTWASTTVAVVPALSSLQPSTSATPAHNIDWTAGPWTGVIATFAGRIGVCQL